MNITEKNDLWSYLKSTSKPIVIYGMGNGADKIINELSKIGREADDIFASDGFVRGHFFLGKQVLSFSEIKEKYEEFIILLSFATRLPDVLENIYSINEKHELYAPDVPVYGEGLFTYDFYLQNEEKIKCAYELLADEKSKQIFENVINYKLSGKICYLKTSQNSYFDIVNSHFKCYNYKYYADGGAYNGDTVIEAEKMFDSLEHIYAFEPDVKNFKKLTLNTSNVKMPHTLYNALLGEKTDTVSFFVRGGRNSSVIDTKTGLEQGKSVQTLMYALDEILPKDKRGLIKLDVEGNEYSALKGCVETIKAGNADLQISLYHRNADIFELILYVNSIYGGYKFYLNRPPYIPAWDTVLYAIKR